MKLYTHIASTLAIAHTYTAIYTPENPLQIISIYLIASLIDYILDSLGHTSFETRDKIVIMRNRLHSVYAVSLYSITAIAVFTYIQFQLLGLIIATSLYTHLLMDMITEGGIYFRGRRIKMFGLRYDDFRINMLVILSALLSIIYMFSELYISLYPLIGVIYCLVKTL